MNVGRRPEGEATEVFVLPPIDEIERIVAEELPPGHHLTSVELIPRTPPEAALARFTLFIRLREDVDADAGHGLAYNIADRIRRRWSRDDIFVSFYSVQDLPE